MTIAEKRKHIKPFLRFAIKELKKIPSKRKSSCLCSLISKYVGINNLPYCIDEYLCSRLDFARPEDSGGHCFWWGDVYYASRKGANLRIDFCKLQLKIVKP